MNIGDAEHPQASPGCPPLPLPPHILDRYKQIYNLRFLKGQDKQMFYFLEERKDTKRKAREERVISKTAAKC